MEQGHLVAFVTFAAGLILLLAWAYATTDNPRSTTILLRSLWLFVLPGAILLALPERFVGFPFSVWVFVGVEECMKAFSSRTEENPLNRFWLVALFGIWELTLAKPVLAILQADELAGTDRLTLLQFGAGACVAVLMHTTTAAIYAFRFKGKLWAALATSWAVHAIYNEAATLFGPSLFFLGTAALILTVLLACLWLQPRRDPALASS